MIEHLYNVKYDDFTFDTKDYIVNAKTRCKEFLANNAVLLSFANENLIFLISYCRYDCDFW